MKRLLEQTAGCPSTVRLVATPPGRLAGVVANLCRTGSYQFFATFIRMGDARHWIMEELRITDDEFSAALIDLDNRQAELLPEKIDDIAPKTKKCLRAIFEFVKVQLRKKGVRGVVRAILGKRFHADSGTPTREFASAVERVNELLVHADDPERFVRLLEEATCDFVPDKIEAEIVDCHGCRNAESGSEWDLPSEWRLHLPIPPAYEELTKISPTRLDSYLRCPFTYFLNRKDVLGDKRMDDRAEALAAWEYGNLAHEALERWALSELRDSADAEAIGSFLAEDVDRQLVERFGAAIPACVARQGASICQRLSVFACRQVEWNHAGWKIVAAEHRMEMLLGHTRLHGKCDRIDRNEQTGQWCVIDYKTWATVDHNGWESLQLPLYCAMLAADPDPQFAELNPDDVIACHCVLGKTAENVVFTNPIAREQVLEARPKALESVQLIERGIFWPPSSKDEWKRDFEDWLSPNPEQTIDENWIADQLKRKEELSHGS